MAEPAVLIVMGVSGSGKSTIAEALAERLGWLYEDGDSFHPPENVAKMKSGVPLTDADRAPWLAAIASEIDRKTAQGQHLVIACSALKKSYRDALVRQRTDIRIVFLNGSKDLIARRVSARKHHFMPASLLDSQFADLQPPGADENPVTVSIDGTVSETVEQIISQLAVSPSP